MSGSSTRTKVVAIRITNKSYDAAMKNASLNGQGISEYLRPCLEDAIQRADASERERMSDSEVIIPIIYSPPILTIVENP